MNELVADSPEMSPTTLCRKRLPQEVVNSRDWGNSPWHVVCHGGSLRAVTAPFEL
jgi:hypothetical protein